MTTLPFGRVVALAVDKATERSDFRVGLAELESFTGRLADRVDTDYDGVGIRFQPGDVLFGKLRPYLAKAWLADRSGEAVGDFHVYRPRDPSKTDPDFLRWAVLARSFLDPVESSVFGAKMPRADWEFVRSIPLYHPPLAQQQAIADYLDRETARIDELITEQERLIELLAERRLAAINDRVTRGLHASAPMTATNLRWAPEVPSHWRVANIRRFAEMRSGHTPSRSKPEYWVDCTIPWFTLADVWQLRDGRQVYLGETENMISELGLANSAADLLPARTVVLSRTASVGFSGIMPVQMATSQDFWNWICGPDLLPDYLLWTFRAMSQEFKALMIGSTHKTIYQPVAAAIRIAVPPIDEQAAIIAAIAADTARVDALTTEAIRLIQLARERRSALITAAVTGQIDVRDAAA